MATPKTGTTRATSGKKGKAAPAPSIEFSLEAPGAREVFLVGDFNAWNGEGFQMRRFKDGTCKKKVQLKPGRYEYRFIVDGDWWTDPRSEERCGNPFGSENSVIRIDR